MMLLLHLVRGQNFVFHSISPRALCAPCNGALDASCNCKRVGNGFYFFMHAAHNMRICIVHRGIFHAGMACASFRKSRALHPAAMQHDEAQ